MKQAFEKFASFGVWRNLADIPAAAPGAVWATHSAVLGSLRGRSGLRPERAFRVKRLLCPDVPQRRGQQQRQAAHGRVAGQNDPCRKRKCHRSSHCQHSDRCRHQNHPCHHLTHPLRVSQFQRAVGAWQDYGRVLVNLRRPEAVGSRPDPDPGQASGRTTLANVASFGFHLWRELRELAGMTCCKLLFHKRFSHIAGRARRGSSCSGGTRGCGLGSSAARCRKPNRGRRDANPDLAAVCLSFVMAAQQAAAGHQGDSH